MPNSPVYNYSDIKLFAHLSLPCPIAVLESFNMEAGILIESGMDSAISSSSDSIRQ